MQSSSGFGDAVEPGASVLIVEDQRLVAADLAMQLRSFGYRVVGFATNGLDAITKAESLRPDLVLMDVHLEGEMDGTEAARQIRAGSDCAIVYLTAFSDMETLERAKLAEPGGYVVKPASPVELRCAVEVALYKQASQQRRAIDHAQAYREELDTVRSQVAHMEDAYRELEVASASLTHDLRNPLQVIAGATQMLEQTQSQQLTPVGRAFLAQVGTAAARMIERISALLELARSNRAELTLVDVDLSLLARQVFDELSSSSPEARCVVAQDMRVFADLTLVRRVLENLLSNALKFTRTRPQPRIEVGSELNREQTCYFVRDNGVGFSMQSAEGRLFTPYGRLHDQSSYEGTGLGLSGARRMVERHGGTMWAHSVEDAGATIFFTLPDSSSVRPPT
jgi:two-component system, sensor histidine kinase and response regulator